MSATEVIDYGEAWNAFQNGALGQCGHVIIIQKYHGLLPLPGSRDSLRVGAESVEGVMSATVVENGFGRVNLYISVDDVSRFAEIARMVENVSQDDLPLGVSVNVIQGLFCDRCREPVAIMTDFRSWLERELVRHQNALVEIDRLLEMVK